MGESCGLKGKKGMEENGQAMYKRMRMAEKSRNSSREKGLLRPPNSYSRG